MIESVYPVNCSMFFSGSVDDSKVARRHRISPYPLISVDEAVQIVLKHADLQATEKIYFKGWCDLVTVTLLKRNRNIFLNSRDQRMACYRNFRQTDQ